MKIVVCHNSYEHAGGEDRVLRDEAQLLRSHGHQVVEFTKHYRSIRGLGRLRLAMGAIWNRRSVSELRDLVSREEADIVHFHNTVPLISPAAYYAGRSAGAAVVQSLHNYRFICPKATFFRNGEVCEQCLGKFFAWPAVVNGCYRDDRSASAVLATTLATHRLLGTYAHAVDRYIAMSGFARGKLIEGGLPADKIDLKPNFVAPDPGFGTGQGGYAMYLGRLSPEKGVDVLLRAWGQAGDTIPLKLAGNGPMSDVVTAATRENPRVKWLAGQSDQQIQQLLSDASFLVLPSINYEGFPKTIVEALSHGTPVIASKLGSMVEIIDHGRNGLHFTPGNPDELAAQVNQMCQDDRRRNRMRREARREYEQRYTADANYPVLMNVYEQAMKTRRMTVEARPSLPPIAEADELVLVEK